MNPVCNLLTCCICQCCNVFSKFNKCAYMDIAVNSNSFCVSASHTASLMTFAMTNTELTGAAWICEFAGCGAICASGALFTYYTSTHLDMYSDVTRETHVEDPVFL